MSQIPSDLPSSAAQAGYHARDVSKVRDAERARQSTNTREAVKGVEEGSSTIETDDNDAAVYADAEGTGSKGRAHEEDLLEGAEDESQPSAECEGEDPPRLDIQA